jgi:hypothetical protein
VTIKQQILFEYQSKTKHLLREREIVPGTRLVVDRVFTQENGKIGYRQRCQALIGLDQVHVTAPYMLPSGVNKKEVYALCEDEINALDGLTPQTAYLEVYIQNKLVQEMMLQWNKPGVEDIKLSSQLRFDPNYRK